jgi:hypothetical protein
LEADGESGFDLGGVIGERKRWRGRSDAERSSILRTMARCSTPTGGRDGGVQDDVHRSTRDEGDAADGAARASGCRPRTASEL